MSNFYCIWVRTGFENKFIEKVQAVFDSFSRGEEWQTILCWKADEVKKR